LEQFEADMVIAQSNSDEDIAAAIAQFEADNSCFDNLINGIK